MSSTRDLAGAEVELTGNIGRESILDNQLKMVPRKYDFISIDTSLGRGIFTIYWLVASDRFLTSAR